MKTVSPATAWSNRAPHSSFRGWNKPCVHSSHYCYVVPLPRCSPRPVARQIEASYEVTTRGIKIAVITEKFIRTGNHYRIESATKPVGLLAVLKPDTIDCHQRG